MATIDDLDLPALRPQAFNVTAPGAMRPRPPATPAAPQPMDSSTQAGVLQNQLPVGGNVDFSRLLSLLPRMTPPSYDPFGNPGALTTAPQTPPTPTPVGTGSGRGTVNPPDAATLPALPTLASPTKPKLLTSGATAAPAAARPATNPGVAANGEPAPGYYFLNGQAVPFGFAGLSGGGGGGATAMPGGGGASYAGGAGLIDPRDYFPDAVTSQLHYARKAAQEILEQAGSGDQLGFSAKLRALSAVYLNGLAGVGQGGANSFNADVAGMSNEASRAAASRYAADRGLTGSLAHAGATEYAADVGASTAADLHEIERARLNSDTQASGTTMGIDPITHMAVPLTTYTRRADLAAMPVTGNAGIATTSSKPQVGKVYVDKQGNRATYNADGTYTPVK